jgi:RNA polymerase sigma factor (sigma-70 family)
MADSSTSDGNTPSRTAASRPSGTRTDAQLLEAFVSREDDAAFAALVTRHGPMVWNVCRQLLRNVHDAEDAVQATFLVLARKASSLRDRELLANWLYGVAQRVALRARAVAARRRSREGEDLDTMPVPAADDTTPSDLMPVLHEEVGRLPHKYRGPVGSVTWRASPTRRRHGLCAVRSARSREDWRGRGSCCRPG